jgi:hypothetical protein
LAEGAPIDVDEEADFTISDVINIKNIVYVSSVELA